MSKISLTRALESLQEENLISGFSLSRREANSINAPSDTEETVPEVDPKPEAISVSAETFGDDSFLFFRCEDEELAKQAQRTLRQAGGSPDEGWISDNDSAFKLPVSYFKGPRWWE